MKTPKQLTPKPNQKSTPNSEGKIKKSNKKKPAVSPLKTPNSAGKMKEKLAQKTPKAPGKSPQSNGQTPAKKGPKTPKPNGKVKKALITEEGEGEGVATPIAIINNTQNKTGSVKKQKKSPQAGKTPQPQKVAAKAQKRKESPDSESESTPPKQVKTSPEEKVRKVRSISKRAQGRQQKKEKHQQILSRLKAGDQAVLENAEKFQAKLAELQSRDKLTKSAARTVRRYKSYLSLISLVKSGGKSDSSLNKSALEHLKSMKKTKSKKEQPNEKASANAKSKVSSPKRNQSKCEVFVKNLPYEIQTEEIAEHFKEVGDVVKVTVPLGREKKGIAYVQFENEEDCQKALSLNQTVLNGRKIHVLSRGAPGGGGFKKSPNRT